MERSVNRGVERHEEIRHYASSAIDCAVLSQRVILERVCEMDAVSAGKLAMLVSIVEVHSV